MYFQFAIIILSGMVIFYTDIKYKKIPNIINLLIFLAGCFYMIYSKDYLLHITGAFVLGGGLLLFAAITKGFGMGDVKYLIASGLLLGLKVATNGLLIGVILGGVYGLYLVIIKKAKGKDTFAYGPFLVIGHTMAMLLEHNILGFIF